MLVVGDVGEVKVGVDFLEEYGFCFCEILVLFFVVVKDVLFVVLML